MKKVWLGLFAVPLLLAAMLFTPREVRAHGTCNDAGCCSPHGQTSSNTGYTFYLCNHPGTWNRNAWGPGGPSCSGYSNGCYLAQADYNHNVVTWLSFCSDGSYADYLCCAYDQC